MDLTVGVNRFPKPGETILGDWFKTSPGGKGANQAVAAARLGGDVSIIGRVGNDFYGQEYLKVLSKNHISMQGINMEDGVSTGIAVIGVDSSGENNIVVVPGANSRVDTDYIDSHLEELSECEIILLQLEIPIEAVQYAAVRLKAMGKTIVLDPAPARELPEELLQAVDYLTPNEMELGILTGIEVKDEEDFKRAAEALLARGVGMVIAKLGSKGAYLIDRHGLLHIPGFDVNTADTTAAGDTFGGGFAVKLALGAGITECIRFANAAAALSTTAFGAQSAMPDMEEVNQLLQQQ
jgi:ribokinase